MEKGKQFFPDECPRLCPMWRHYEDCNHMYIKNRVVKTICKPPKIPQKSRYNPLAYAKDGALVVRGSFHTGNNVYPYEGFINVVELRMGVKKTKTFDPHSSDSMILQCIEKHDDIRQKITKLAQDLNIIGHYDDIICCIDKYWHCTRVLEESIRKNELWKKERISVRMRYAKNLEMRLWFAENVAIPMLHVLRNKHRNSTDPIIIIGPHADMKEITDVMHMELLIKLQLSKNLQEMISYKFPYLMELTTDFHANPGSYLHNELKPHSWLFDLEHTWGQALQEATQFPTLKTSKLKALLLKEKEPTIKQPPNLQCTAGFFHRDVVDIKPRITCPVLLLRTYNDKAELIELPVSGNSAVHTLSYTNPFEYNKLYE